MGTKLHTHFLPYRPDQLYDLVADVEKYPEFLPWCLGARVIARTNTEMIADLSVGYAFFRETFRSKVHLTPKTLIEVEYINGPFNHLNNRWDFKDKPGLGTEIEFFIDFQFKNGFFQSAAHMMFEKAFDTMLEAFQRRAQQVYGTS